MESSLWQDEDDATCKVFVTMMALKAPDHILRLSAYQIGKKCNKTEAEVLKALKILEAPDTNRIEPQEFEGRRIERVKDGWLILNGQKYQEMMQEMIRQRQQAQWQREERLIQRAVRTGEGIAPDKLTPAIQKRLEKAKAKRQAKGQTGGERGRKDVEDYVDKGRIMPPRDPGPAFPSQGSDPVEAEEELRNLTQGGDSSSNGVSEDLR